MSQCKQAESQASVICLVTCWQNLTKDKTELQEGARERWASVEIITMRLSVVIQMTDSFKISVFPSQALEARTGFRSGDKFKR